MNAGVDDLGAAGQTAKLKSVTVVRNPVFIIASPRSGTTALAEALGRHSELWYKGESQLLYDAVEAKRLRKVYASAQLLKRWTHKHAVTREEFLESVGMGFNAMFTSRSGGKRWIEKTPRNTLIVDLLGDMFPEASFIHILRDGRSVVNSMTNFLNRIDAETQQNWRVAGGQPKWATDFERACLEWRRHVNLAMWLATTRPERCLTVRSEALLEDSEQGFREIFEFLRIPCEGAPAEHYATHQINSSFHRSVVAPEFHERKEPCADWSAQQREAFVRVAGRTMVKYGLMSQDELGQLRLSATDADVVDE